MYELYLSIYLSVIGYLK